MQLQELFGIFRNNQKYEKSKDKKEVKNTQEPDDEELDQDVKNTRSNSTKGTKPTIKHGEDQRRRLHRSNSA